MIKAIVIDDEESGRKVMANMLANYCPEVEIAGSATSVSEGLQLIKLNQPDLVFLDIEMPPHTGFDLLEALDEIPFGIIFTTAHNHYTIKAIRLGALDYLLKPLDAEDLKAAVKRFKERNINLPQPTEYLAGVIRHPDDPDPRIIISTSDSVFVLYVKDIVYCEGSGSYTVMHMKNKEDIVASKNMKEFEGILQNHGFFRIHQSFLVNLKEVKKYNKTENTAVMITGAQIDVARRKKDEFLEALSKS